MITKENKIIITQEDRELFLKDLCQRLPYGVKLHNVTTDEVVELYALDVNSEMASFWTYRGKSLSIGNNSRVFRMVNGTIRLRPFLRRKSSMTEEEKNEYRRLCDSDPALCIDYLNSIHVDTHDLISKGIAIAVTPDNNPYEPGKYDNFTD